MSPEYLQHPHDCRGSSSAALLESVKLVSSVAGPANELPATRSSTDEAGYGADSTVRIQSTLKFAALYGGYVVDQAVTCPSSVRKIDERIVSTLSSTETALLPLRGQHSQGSGSPENVTGSIQSPGLASSHGMKCKPASSDHTSWTKPTSRGTRCQQLTSAKSSRIQRFRIELLQKGTSNILPRGGLSVEESRSLIPNHFQTRPVKDDVQYDTNK